MDFLVKKTVLMPFALTVLCFFCSLPIKSNATTACGQCTASMNGAECTLRPSGSSLPGMDTEWNCKLYMCRLGGGVSWN